jgi:MFS family permease
MHHKRNLSLIYAGAFLRSLGIGLLGVVLGIYLFRIGLSSLQIGIVIGAGLAGAVFGMLLLSFRGDRVGRRKFLFVVCVLSAMAGFSLAFETRFSILVVLAFATMLNGMGTDRTAAFASDQAIVAELVAGQHRTWALSWYNLVLDIGHALGALAAGLPVLLKPWFGNNLFSAYQAIFFAFAAVNLLNGMLYLLLTAEVEIAKPAVLKEELMRSAGTKRIVSRLAALASLDSFGGGFLTDALIAYWFFRRFDVQEQALGMLFFTVHVLNAASYLGAAWLARRIGLLNTMVFTHLPSSVLLIAVPFAPNLWIAILLFLLRELLVEMDVPTRQSYVLALVLPRERTFASGVTNLARNVSWALASSLSGVVMQFLNFSSPLFLGGAAKIAYDLLLYRNFRKVKPPEELTSASTPPDVRDFATAGEKTNT